MNYGNCTSPWRKEGLDNGKVELNDNEELNEDYWNLEYENFNSKENIENRVKKTIRGNNNSLYSYLNKYPMDDLEDDISSYNDFSYLYNNNKELGICPDLNDGNLNLINILGEDKFKQIISKKQKKDNKIKISTLIDKNNISYDTPNIIGGYDGLFL